MDLPEDIRLKIEANTYKEIFVDVVSRLQSEGVVITHDVLAAIQATIDLTREVEEQGGKPSAPSYRGAAGASCWLAVRIHGLPRPSATLVGASAEYAPLAGSDVARLQF